MDQVRGLEYVAGIYNTSNSSMNVIKGADVRYYNLYSSTTSIAGDATLETQGWKGGSNRTFVNGSDPVFLRNYEELFGYGSMTVHYKNSNLRFACGYGHWYWALDCL